MKQIKTLEELAQAMHDKKAVSSPKTNFIKIPAAVIMHMQGVLIKRLIDNGLFIYQTPKKEA